MLEVAKSFYRISKVIEFKPYPTLIFSVDKAPAMRCAASCVAAQGQLVVVAACCCCPAPQLLLPPPPSGRTIVQGETQAGDVFFPGDINARLHSATRPRPN